MSLGTLLFIATLASAPGAWASPPSRVVLGIIETDNPEFKPIPIMGVVSSESEFLGLEFLESGEMRFYSVEELASEPTVKRKRGFNVVRASVDRHFDSFRGGSLRFKFRGNIAGTRWLKDTKPIAPDMNGEWRVWCGDQPCQKVRINFKGGMFPEEMAFE